MCRHSHGSTGIHESYDLGIIDRRIDIDRIDPLFGYICRSLLNIRDDRDPVNAADRRTLHKDNSDDLIACLLIAEQAGKYILSRVYRCNDKHVVTLSSHTCVLENVFPDHPDGITEKDVENKRET